MFNTNFPLRNTFLTFGGEGFGVFLNNVRIFNSTVLQTGMIEIEEGSEFNANDLEFSLCRSGGAASALMIQPNSVANINRG